MFLNSYRKKLITIFIFIAIIPVLLISLIMNFRVKEETKNEEIYLKEELLRNMCKRIDMWIKDKEEISKTIVSNYSLLKDMVGSEGDYGKVNNYLKSYVSNSESIQRVYIVLENGKSFSSHLKPIGDNTKDKDWYKNTYKKRGIVWTKPTNSLLTDNSIVTLSTPLYDENGGFIGVLGMDISINNLVNEIKGTWITNNGSIYVIDSERNIVMGLGDDILGFNSKENIYKKETDIFIRTLMSKDTGNTVLKLDKEYFTVYSKIPSIDWRVTFITEKGNFFQSVSNVYEYIVYSMAATFILVIMLAFKFSKDFSTPLEKLKAGALEIQKGNYDYKIDTYKNDEFGHVAEAFNNMASQIKESHKKLESQTDQLLENNKQLQEMNIELEASFEQLQATMTQLNDSEEKYRTLIENMYDLVWIIDVSGNLVFINNQVEAMLSYRQVIVGNFSSLILIIQYLFCFKFLGVLLHPLGSIYF
jgi:methyl-accepting chemotaxis protein